MSSALAQVVTAVEYYNKVADVFFLTARATEQAALDAIPDFQRTGMTFAATAGNSNNARSSICRFYISLAEPYTSSHFYGLQTPDCDQIQQINPAGFSYEGIDFAVGQPVTGACGGTTPVPVYRSFRATAPRARSANHRYTVSRTSYDGMATLGWTQEGVAFCVASATDQTAAYPLPYAIGKNRFAPTIDGDIREYFVHVPARYNPLQPTPVVFMLHGRGGTGEKFYDISGWKETGESNNILTVFPSSWVNRCIIDDGAQVLGQSRWNSWGFTFCDAADRARNDLKFLGQIIDDLRMRFNVDTRRVYFVGFSNGGEMVSRSSIDLGDRLAGVIANAGVMGALNTKYTPRRPGLPVALQVGTLDDYARTLVGTTQELPMDIAQLYTTYPVMQGSVNSYLLTFDMKPGYTVTGSASSMLTAHYSGRSIPSNVFLFNLVKGLAHEYPNGVNHPMKGAEVHWAWLSQFSLP